MIIRLKNAHVLPCTLRFFRQIIIQPCLKYENYRRLTSSLRTADVKRIN